MRVRKFAKNGIFRDFDSLDDGHVFIIVFEDSNPIINSREKFHRDSIKNTEFHDLNHFCRTTIH